MIDFLVQTLPSGTVVRTGLVTSYDIVGRNVRQHREFIPIQER